LPDLHDGPKHERKQGKIVIQGLETLDGRLLDGLTFCRRAYSLLDRIHSSPGGTEELRLHRSQRSKKLIEEILPLVAYVQSRYSPGLRLRIQWFGGNQSYDARQLSSGYVVECGGFPREQYLEVTMAVHERMHLAREHFSTEGFSFGPRGTCRDRKTRKITSAPTVYDNQEAQEELIELIRKRITDKASKDYPKDTSLIVPCEVSMLFLDDEWEYVIRELHDKPVDHPFREIILLEAIGRRVASLRGLRCDDAST
jgi:hypothetical protein